MSSKQRRAGHRSLRLVAVGGIQVNETPKERQVHLLDIENLIGSGRFTDCEVAHLAATYVAVAHPTEGAHLVAAASSSAGLIATGYGWQGLRLRWQPGHDGADQCLLEVLEEENIAERFDHVVIASGDGAFAGVARALVNAGLRVTVVGRYGHISHMLYSAVADIRYLPYDDAPAVARAA